MYSGCGAPRLTWLAVGCVSLCVFLFMSNLSTQTSRGCGAPRLTWLDVGCVSMCVCVCLCL